MNNPNLSKTNHQPGERGWGLLEYALIAGLLALTLMSVYLVFGPDIRNFLGSLFRREPAAPQIEIVVSGETNEAIDVEVIPLRNCESTEELNTDVERSRQFQHKFILDLELEEEIARVLTQRLEEYYGFKDGQPEERRYSINLTAPASSGVDYTLEWQNKWDEGQIIITWPEGEQDNISYQALTSVEFMFTNIQQIACP